MNGFVNDRWHTGKGKAKEKTSRYGVGKQWQAVWLDPKGQQHSKAFSTRDEARSFLEQTNVTKLTGAYIDPNAGKMTLSAYVEGTFLPLSRVRENTMRNRVTAWSVHTKERLGDYPLVSITTSIVNTWLKELEEKGLAITTRKRIRSFLGQALDAAVEDGKIVKNPLRSKTTYLGPNPRKEMVVWSEQTASAIHERLSERYRIAFLLGAHLGLRQGEVFGLAVEDINFLKKKITIRRQVKQEGKVFIYGSTKTQRERTIPVSDHLVMALSAHIQAFPPKAITLPFDRTTGKPITASLILTDKNGGPVRALSFNAIPWKRATQGLGQPKGFHQLRHYFASHFLANGGSVTELSVILGHTNTSMTLNTYAHLVPNSDERARKVMDSGWTVNGQ